MRIILLTCVASLAGCGDGGICESWRVNIEKTEACIANPKCVITQEEYFWYQRYRERREEACKADNQTGDA